MTASVTDEGNIPVPGIGIDVVDLDRFRNAFRQKGFRDKVFSEAEIAYCESQRFPISSYAARFAAKEAFFKALADPSLKSVPWKQIETINNNNVLNFLLSKNLQKRMAGRRAFVSLTHSEQIAAAVVLIYPIAESNERKK